MKMFKTFLILFIFFILIGTTKASFDTQEIKSEKNEIPATHIAPPIPQIQNGDCSRKYKELENLEEEKNIEIALLEQGYYNDFIPLEYIYQDYLKTSCIEYDVDYSLALAIIQVESDFDIDAVGIDGKDIGLFQIRECNHQWLSEETGENPNEVYGNIRCGVYMLSYLLEMYEGDEEAALTAYRWGNSNSDRTYANNVLSIKNEWEDILF